MINPAYGSSLFALIGLLLGASACSPAPASDAGVTDSGTVDALDTSDDANPPDALAHCFEIFPAAPTWADGGTVSGEAGGVPHTNPLAYEFGSVPVGQTVTASIRYYNFCGDPAAAIVAAASEPDAEATSFTVTPPTAGPVMTDVTWSVAFHPVSAGEHRLTVRVRTNAGSYQTDLHGIGQ